MTAPVETRRVAVISTDHLSPETLALLSGPREAWPIYGGAYGGRSAAGPDGFLIHVAEDVSDLPNDLAGVCAWAHGRFDYLMVDQDADTVAALPVYERAGE